MSAGLRGMSSAISSGKALVWLLQRKYFSCSCAATSRVFFETSIPIKDFAFLLDIKVLLSQPCECGLEAHATVRFYGKRGATPKLPYGLMIRQRANGLLHPSSTALFKRSDT